MEIERYITLNRAVCSAFNSINGNCGECFLLGKLAQRTHHDRFTCEMNAWATYNIKCILMRTKDREKWGE